jgi:hypothetical protein
MQEEFEKHTSDTVLFAKSFDKIQEQVAREFGYEDINVLQSAQARFPKDQQICDTFYIKRNKCEDGAIKVGDQISGDITLYNLRGDALNFGDSLFTSREFEEKTPSLPVVVIAGSLT